MAHSTQTPETQAEPRPEDVRPLVDLTDTMSADDVSQRLGIHRDEVYRMAGTGEIASLRIGRRRRFPRAWLQAYLRTLAAEQGMDLNEYDEVA
jgi:excisionase family DNA binding protein